MAGFMSVRAVMRRGGCAMGRRFFSSGPSKVLVSLAGPDRVGIVKEFSQSLRGSDGNMEESRMAQLGGEFAMIALVTIHSSKLAELHSGLKKNFPEFSLAVRETADSGTKPKLQEYKIEIDGPDSPGIVASITETLAKKGASIKNLETETVAAPFAGFDLFKMECLVEIDPAHLDEVEQGVVSTGEKFGLDIASIKKVE